MTSGHEFITMHALVEIQTERTVRCPSHGVQKAIGRINPTCVICTFGYRSTARRPADCHPLEQNKARGLCAKCYAENRKKYAPRATSCPHRERAKTSKDGLCASCTSRRWRMARDGVTGVPLDMGVECGICHEQVHDLAMDHDHKTMKFRGWLCRPCNAGLGFFKDEPCLLMNAISYLEAVTDAT